MVLCAIAVGAVLAAADPDSDSDGLSDFREVHKYFTDPQKADSDGDGVPDGDWNERREYAYSVRAIVQVAPPVALAELDDDYQDARVLEVRDDAIELEVVLYPFNTVASDIPADPEWRAHATELKRWVEPGLTSNWDAALQKQIVQDLAKDGIDAAKLSDKELAKRAAHWLLKRAPQERYFTTFATDFSDGKPRVAAGMEKTVSAELEKAKRTLDDQWARELFGKSMYELKTRGECTSTAIYLSTGLKALGLPTRTIVTIPVVDASDPREREWVEKRITHPEVRDALLSGLEWGKDVWTSHTYNEVFVGGRWRRLNAARLGQNILDNKVLGLMVHVNTFRDHAEAGLTPWGLRRLRDPKADVFGGSNPYSCVSLSELYGAHTKQPKPALTVRRAYWYEDAAKPAMVTLKGMEEGGHIFLHVDKVPGVTRFEQLKALYDATPKGFVLKAAGQPDVQAQAKRGFWVDEGNDVREFYVHVPAKELAKMKAGVSYAVVPAGGWVVVDGVTVAR